MNIFMDAELLNEHFEPLSEYFELLGKSRTEKLVMANCLQIAPNS